MRPPHRMIRTSYSWPNISTTTSSSSKTGSTSSISNHSGCERDSDQMEAKELKNREVVPDLLRDVCYHLTHLRYPC